MKAGPPDFNEKLAALEAGKSCRFPPDANYRTIVVRCSMAGKYMVRRHPITKQIIVWREPDYASPP